MIPLLILTTQWRLLQDRADDNDVLLGKRMHYMLINLDVVKFHMTHRCKRQSVVEHLHLQALAIQMEDHFLASLPASFPASLPLARMDSGEMRC